MFVKGQTIPAVSNAKVTINRDNKISLKDREPHVVMTDEQGNFKYGPVDIDTYQVEISKDDYVFTRTDKDSSYNFKAQREARLEI